MAQETLHLVASLNKYATIVVMDFIIGFLLGYFLKEIVSYLKRLSQWDWDNRKSWDKEWDWIEPIQEDDLP